MRRNLSVRRTNHTLARRGFTLVELLVAILLIDVGVLAMVSGTAMIARRQVELRTRVAATQLAANRIQRLVAARCVDTTGSSTADRGIVEHWRLALLANAQREIHDSVVFNINGVERSVVTRARASC